MSLVNDMLNDLDERRVDRGKDTVNLDWMAGQKHASKKLFLLPGLWFVGLLGLLFIAYQLWSLNRSGGMDALEYLAGSQSAAMGDESRQASSDARESEALTAPITAVLPRDTEAKSPVNRPVNMISGGEVSAPVPVLNVTGIGKTEKTKVSEKVVAKSVAILGEQETPTTIPQEASLTAVKKLEAVTSEVKTKRPLSLQQRDIQAAQAADKLFKQGRFVDAEKQLVDFMLANPLAVRSGEALASLWMSQQQYGKTQSLLNRLRETKPRHIGLIKSQARLYLLTDQVNSAVELLMSEKPALHNNPDYYELLGLASRKNQQYQLSVQAYKGLLEYDSARGDWWVAMAIALDLRGQSAKAREAYQRGMNSRSLNNQLRDYAQQRLSVL